MNIKASLILGVSITTGLFLLGYTLGGSLLKYRELERTVTVKGLSEKEVKANVVIWPITFLRVNNDLSELYSALEIDTKKITSFLIDKGFGADEISVSAPIVVDKLAQNYGNSSQPKFRYSATQTLSVYTSDISKARENMRSIASLGKKGVNFRAGNYENKIEFIYSKLSEIKPDMLKEATKNARESAQTFADDSKSKLGKIKKARQGQFSISSRDQNTPYIKKVRVVSTIEYYLAD